MNHDHGHARPTPGKELFPLLSTPHETAIDPVCGMPVDPATAAGSFTHAGQTYYFCNPHCFDRFRADPTRYLKPTTIRVEPGCCPGATYICPMHPEVVQDHPGACPKCGMALEPRTVSLEDRPDPELADTTRRFVVGMVLTVPLVALAMGGMLGFHLESWMRTLNWVQLALAVPVVCWCGWPFFERARSSVVHRSPNMFTLIALGVGVAFVYSVAGTVAPGLFPEGLQVPGSGGALHTYFETAAAITVLVLLGQVLEVRARGKASTAIRQLLGLTPKTARIVRADGLEEDVPLESIRPGDILRVRPGEKVPVDAVVTEGRSAVDEAMISGEPIPAEKEPGSKVIGGTVNGTGALLIRAERVGADTLLAQIVRLVSEAQRSRAPVQRLADEVARYFVPAVLAVSVLTFMLWLVLDQGPERFAHALMSAVAVLIIACPCALGLATPMAVVVGAGRGAENGVLIKNAEALETLQKADTLIVDKTGTLTEGKPRLGAVEPAEGFAAGELLRLAAGLERASEHPLAAAIVRGAEAKRLNIPLANDFQSVTGKGVIGQVEGRRVVLGNAALLADTGITLAGTPDFANRIEARQREGQTVMLAAVDGRLAGMVCVADPVRESTPEAIGQLHADGLRIIMVTGDGRRTAEAVGQRLGIDEVIAEVLPQDKSSIIKRLQAEGHVVAMAGDGINDAPALAEARIGIAMGTGTDVAMESAGVILVQGDLRGIARARRLSRATMRTIRQNLFLAFVYNTLSIPLAAVGIMSPILASAAMSLSSLSVVGNSLRLRRRTI
jgi:Cu+-exporting ATPase